MTGEQKAWTWCIAFICLTIMTATVSAFLYNGYKVSHHPRVDKRVVVKVVSADG